MHWDVFCRVIDNFGDIGVCWRLARDLASRGHEVRLWVDDASPLAWMAPGGAPGVEVRPWPQATDQQFSVGEVVIEAFGCELPDAFVRAMAQAASPPRWINLEYLSAEGYVARSHGLKSPQSSGPGRGLDKWFHFPGFTSGTGGLIREPGLMREQALFDPAAWLSAQGIRPLPGERLLSLFCYDARPTLPGLLELLAPGPWLLLAAEGIDVPGDLPPTVRIQHLPRMAQPQYDRLLWSCDLNLVRGEDSFVRAQWAARPFVWQIYPQSDDAHATKLDAYLGLFLAGLEADERVACRALFNAWNGLGALPPRPPLLDAWSAHCRAWRTRLEAEDDLVTQLIRSVEKTG